MLPVLVIITSLTIFFLAALSETSIASVSKTPIHTLLAQNKAGAKYLYKLRKSSSGSIGAIYLVMLGTIILSVLYSAILTINQMDQSLQLISTVSLTLIIVLESYPQFARLAASYKAETIALKTAFFIHMITLYLFLLIIAKSAILHRKSIMSSNDTMVDGNIYQNDITLALISND